MQTANHIHGMNSGAIGIIDALGFKGIWRSRESAEVLSLLRSIKSSALSDARFLKHLVSQGIDVQCVFFSDAMIITAARLPDADVPDSELVAHVAIVIQGVIAKALSGKHRLVYRGCISFGAFMAQEEFFVGPAIDEAAAWCERANAAVVWLLPSARAVFDGAANPVEFFSWDVPVKGEGSHLAWVVDPYGRADLDGLPGLPGGLRPSPTELRTRMLDCFDATRVEVLVKKEATERLLIAADENHGRRIAGTTAADGSINP